MKRLCLALFMVAASARAQFTDFAHHGTARAGHANGLPAGKSVGPYSGTPVLGDMIVFNGTNWVSVAAGTNGQVLTENTNLLPTWQNAAGGAAFSGITSGTNTTAAMVCGTGCSVAPSGSGTITATSVPGSGVTGTVACAQQPALTGPVTTSAGSCATAVALTQATDGGAVVAQASSPGTQQGSSSSKNININGKAILELDAIGTTPTDEVIIQNGTSAALGAQQDSPAMKLCGNGWNNGGSANEVDCWRVYTVPTQGNPTLNALSFDSSINGGAYSVGRMSITAAGNLTMAGSITAGSSVLVGSASNFTESASGSSSVIQNQNSETTTINTGGATTTTVGNLAPANSRIRAIVGRINQAINNITSFTVKVTGGNVFSQIGTATTANSTLTLGTQYIWVPSAYADQYNTSATTLTITTTGSQNTTGTIHFVVFYETFAAPTS